MLILFARYGNKATPSYAAPVYSPLFEAPKVSIMTKVEITSTPGMIATPIYTPLLPPSNTEFKILMNMLPSLLKEMFSSFPSAFTASFISG